MRVSKPGRWVILLTSAPLVGVLSYLLLWPIPEDPPPPKYVSVAFVGHTNGAFGQALPQFAVSNVSRFRIECSFIGPTVRMTNSSRTSTNVTWGWQPGWTNQFLRAGESAIVSAEPPTNGVPWSFTVLAMRPTTSWQRTLDKLEPRLPSRVYRLLRRHTRTQLLQSPGVGPRATGGIQPP